MKDYEIYVSPLGNDANEGTKENPFRTLSHAKDAAALHNKTGHVTVYLREGDYYGEALTFEGGDSNVTYTAYEGEKVSVNGGIKITEERITKVEDEALLNRLIDKEARNRLYRIDVSDHKDALYDIRPAREGSFRTTTLIRNGNFMEPARFPKRGKERHKGETYVHSIKNEFTGEINKSPAYIYFDDEAVARMRLWNKDVIKNLWMFGYFRWHWADETQRIVELDPDNGRALFDGRPFMYSLNIAPKWWEKVYQKCYFFNIFDELSRESEYFIDKENGYIYIISDGDFAKDDIWLGVQDVPFADMDGATNVDFINMHFVNNHNRMFLLKNCRGINFNNCEMAHGSQDAIFMENTFDVTVDTCDIYDFCRGGIRLLGCGVPYTLTPANITIKNCIMHDVAKTVHCYVPCIATGDRTCGVKILNCTLYNSPHNLLNLGISQNVEIGYCEIYNGAADTDDASVIYWGRNPTTLGHKIHNCYFHHCKCDETMLGTFVIYMDDSGTGADIYNNIFYEIASPQSSRVIQGAIFHNTHNNIFVTKTTPDAGYIEGWNEWAVWCSGAYNPDYFPMPRTSTTVNHYYEPLRDCGFFTQTWRDYYKGTFWETMFNVLTEDKVNAVLEMREKVKDDPQDLQAAKLKYFALPLFASHKFFNGDTYEGNIFDVIKEKYPQEYEKAVKEVEGKGEAAYMERMYLLAQELHREKKLKADYPNNYYNNLAVGTAFEYVDNGQLIGASNRMGYVNQSNNLNMNYDKFGSGESIFKKYGEDFTLTEEGLKYVQSKIEGFEPIDQSEIGAKRL